MKSILFDLDGTLTDSGEGIINCAALGLSHFGIPLPTREELRSFVGPPLHESFVRFGVPRDKAEEAVSVYRSRYIPIGMYENELYPGIRELLALLQEKGYGIYLATSKPEEMAKEILRHFGLTKYFTRICGATMDESRTSKDTVIAYLLESCGDVKNAIMVGDTVYDILGARAHGIPAIGVTWGYGNGEEMAQAGAAAVVSTVAELGRLLMEET